MKFYAKNFTRSVFAHPKVNMVILFDLILTAAAVFVLIQNFYFLKEKHDEFFSEDRVAKTYELCVGDEVLPLTESDVHSKSTMYYIGLKLYDEINSTSIKVFDYSSLDRTYFMKREFDEDTRKRMDESGHGKGAVEMYEMTNYALEGLGLKIAEGRWFNKQESEHPFLLDQVPIVMGNEFLNAFQIGDVIFYDDGFTYDEAVVIGFLESNPGIEYYGVVQGSFDDAIIFPSGADYPRSHQKKYRDEYDPDKLVEYTQRHDAAAFRERVRTLTDGYLYCPDETIDVQKVINDYTSKYGFYQITATPIDGAAYSETKSISERNLLLIGVLAVSTTVICMISLGGVLYNRTLDDRRTYCIYMSAGIPLWKINLSLILEMLFWMVLSILPVIALSLYEYQTLMIPLWQIGLFELIVMAVSIAPSLGVNSKCNLDLLIRNQMN